MFQRKNCISDKRLHYILTGLWNPQHHVVSILLEKEWVYVNILFSIVPITISMISGISSVLQYTSMMQTINFNDAEYNNSGYGLNGTQILVRCSLYSEK